MGRESYRHLCLSDKHLVLEFQQNGNPQFNGETFRKRELRKAVRLRLRSASPLGSPKDDNRPRKGNGEPTATAMTTRMTINGVSTCQTAGTEKYEKYQTTIRRKRTTLFQYDYRHTDGELFSCVRPTLEECRHLRDEWIKGKEDRL